MIVTDIATLKTTSARALDVVVINHTVDILTRELTSSVTGLALSAIQVGIPLRVALISGKLFKSGEPLVLINPVITSAHDRFLFYNEGCLSFPGLHGNVYRYRHCTFTTDVIRQFDGQQKLYAEYQGTEQYAVTYSKDVKDYVSYDPLVCIVIQHEIDHMDGKILPEYIVVPAPIVRKESLPERNEPCPFCAKEGVRIKWKKCTRHNNQDR